MDWTDLAQDRGRWQALVNAVMNLQVPYNAGSFRLVEDLLASQEGLYSMELGKLVIQQTKDINWLAFIWAGEGRFPNHSWDKFH
jgi:hypothetical protein